MIDSRAPVRFSLGGGGTDLPSYANQFGGFVVSAAVDKYVYVNANRRFYDTIRLSYSKTETVDSLDAIEHRIFREALRKFRIERGIELVSMADVPANCGLGSSGAFTVALLNALYAYSREYVSLAELAAAACHIELDILKEPIGKQDQYASAFGRLMCLTIARDGSVHVDPLRVTDDVLAELESNLHVFYTGIERKASTVLADQQQQIAGGGKPVEAMHKIKELGLETRRVLEKGDVDALGEIFHTHWLHKRQTSSRIADDTIDEHYAAARKAGAIGGKLMGAGGGGFFLFYARDRKADLIEALTKRGLRYMRFHFDMEGAKIVANLRR